MPMIRVSYELKECLENLKKKMGKSSLNEVISQQIFGRAMNTELGIMFTTKIVPPIEIIESVKDIPFLSGDKKLELPEHEQIYVAIKMDELENCQSSGLWLSLMLRKAIEALLLKSKDYSVNSPIFVFRKEEMILLLSFFPNNSKINKGNTY